MKKYKVTSHDPSVVKEYIVLAKTEDEALENWGEDKNIVSSNKTVYGDDFLDVEEIVE